MGFAFIALCFQSAIELLCMHFIHMLKKLNHHRHETNFHKETVIEMSAMSIRIIMKCKLTAFAINITLYTMLFPTSNPHSESNVHKMNQVVTKNYQVVAVIFFAFVYITSV